MRLIQTGPKNTKIVWVGEAPGEAEDRAGLPFIGGSGTILRQMLGRTKLPPLETTFVTNVCHVKPPKNEFSWFMKKDNIHHLMNGVVQLKKDLDEIKPNVVVALGAQPLRILTNRLGIDKWRGSILESTLCPGIKVIGTYHPAYILRIPDYKAVAEFDLARIREEMLFPEINLPQRTYHLPNNTTLEQRLQLVEELYSATELSIDIECVKRDDKWVLDCVGFSDHPGRAVVLDYNDQFNHYLIKKLCEAPMPKVLQNGTFDRTVLLSHDIFVNNFTWDTMIAQHALYMECAGGSDEMSAMTGKKRQSAIGKGLAFLASINTREPYYKDDGKVHDSTGSKENFWLYNGKDAAVTMECRITQEKDLREYGTMDTFRHSMALVEPLAIATDRGIRIDLDARARLMDKYTQEIANLQSLLNGLAGFPVNVKSNKDVAKLLYETLKLPVQRNKKSGNVTADKDAVHTLAVKHPHPALLTILAIRERRDLIERYLQATIDSDGRMRSSADITGTRTGRLAYRKSIYGSGTNLQTIPEEIRCMFVPDEGHVFLYRDYKQAEAVVVAHLARCRGLIELFDDPTRDIHKENAARIFGKRLEDITKTERYLAKKVVHASNYGIEAKRLVEIVNQETETTGVRINVNQAEDLLMRYFAIYPEIREVFWGDVRKEINYSRTLTNAFGRKRTFFGRYDDKLLRDAYSWKPQSTIGELGTRALVRIHHDVPQCQVLLNVHDSILVQCKPEHILEVAAGMENAMRIPLTIFGREFYIPTDCKVGYNWTNKSDTNPNGLEDIEKCFPHMNAA